MSSTLIEPVFDHSFLPTRARQPQEKLEIYAQLITKYTKLIQLQGDVMRGETERLQRAYDLVAAEFATEQSFVKNTTDPSFILADLSEYHRRCDIVPKSFEE